eukprot:gene5653-15740_t
MVFESILTQEHIQAITIAWQSSVAASIISGVWFRERQGTISGFQSHSCYVGTHRLVVASEEGLHNGLISWWKMAGAGKVSSNTPSSAEVNAPNHPDMNVDPASFKDHSMFAPSSDRLLRKAHAIRFYR